MSLDADALKQFQFLVFTKLEGAITSGMIHLGDKLGLYRALADGGPLTTAELATATGLDERWVREWAHNQAAAKLLSVNGDGSDERFSMTPEAAAVLASPDHEAFGMGMFHRLPQTMATLRELPEIFRTGLGHDYDSHGPEGAVGIERSFEPWNRAHLLPDVVPAMDGMADRLAAGARVADVGCGAGGAVLLLADAFPASTFTGYDISQYALARANERLGETGLTNASFADPREAPAAQRPLARPRHDVRLHPRHDRPAGDDARHQGRGRATTARGCSSTSRRATRSRRTSPRTRWRR